MVTAPSYVDTLDYFVGQLFSFVNLARGSRE